MLPHVNDPFKGPEWGSDDASIWREFLKTSTGKKLVHRLRNDRPDLSTESTEKASLAGAAVLGYEEAVSNLFEYTISVAEESDKSERYPGLHRDELFGPDLQPEHFQLPPGVVQLPPGAIPNPTASFDGAVDPNKS